MADVDKEFDFSALEDNDALEDLAHTKSVESKTRKKKITTRLSSGPTKDQLDQYKNLFFDQAGIPFSLRDMPTIKGNKRGIGLKQILKEFNMTYGDVGKRKAVKKILEKYGVTTQEDAKPAPTEKDYVPSSDFKEDTKRAPVASEDISTRKELVAKIVEYYNVLKEPVDKETIDNASLEELRATYEYLCESIGEQQNTHMESEEFMNENISNALTNVLCSASIVLENTSGYTEKVAGISFKGLAKNTEESKEMLNTCIQDIVRTNPDIQKYLTPLNRLCLCYGVIVSKTVLQNHLKNGSGE